MKILDLFESYLRLERGLSDNTATAYRLDVEKLAGWLVAEADAPVDDEAFMALLRGVGEPCLHTFMASLADLGISARSRARILSGVKSFFHFLWLEKVVEADPTALLEAPQVSKTLPEVLTVEEVDAMIGAVDLGKDEGLRNVAMKFWTRRMGNSGASSSNAPAGTPPRSLIIVSTASAIIAKTGA